MLPSRGQIQVSLDDTGTNTRVIQCKPPSQVQVKILRRPKPQTSDDNQSAASMSAKVHNNCLDVFEERLSSENPPSSSGLEESRIAPTFAERVRNSGNSLRSTSYASRCSANSDASYPSSSSSFNSNKTMATKEYLAPAGAASTQAQALRTANGQQQAMLDINRAGNDSELGKNRRNVLRTYQERVNEYAKARLRILGSAFPDNDDPPTDIDDVNTCA